MAKQTKANLQIEIGDLQKQIDQLEKRRGDLQAEHERIITGVKAQTRSIGTALLEGRDTTKETESRDRDRAKLETLGEAITQADDRLRNLRDQHATKQRAIVRVDFDQVADETYDLLLRSLDQLSDAVAGLDELEEKFIELNRVGQPAGFNSDSDDHLRLARQICHYLRGDFSASDGINNKLKHVETSYPSTLALARERAKR